MAFDPKHSPASPSLALRKSQHLRREGLGTYCGVVLRLRQEGDGVFQEASLGVSSFNYHLEMSLSKVV